MPEPDAYQANLQRGTQLLALNRPREAIPFLENAIAARPQSAHAFAQLARAWNEIPSHRGKALPIIDQAIALAPTASACFGLKAWFLVCNRRYKAAKVEAENGIALNPNCMLSLNALANAYTKLGQWKGAEEACLRILAQNPNDSDGLNLLAQAVRRQGRVKESREIVDHILALVPNNALGHANAGYCALAVGNHLRANEHFLEALRLNPRFEHARQGLLQSIRARIWIIRLNFRILSAVPGRVLGVIMIGLSLASLIFMWPGFANPDDQHDLLFSWPGIIVCGWISYLGLSILATLLTNFLLTFDSVGRHALRPQEKDYAAVPAFLYFLAVLVLFFAQAWTAAWILILLFAILAFSVQYPLLKDRWHRRHEARSLT